LEKLFSTHSYSKISEISEIKISWWS
jgi:hypothetical protein